MLRPTVIKAIPMNDYKLTLSFDNGETKVFDVKPYIKGSWFGELQNASYFKTVHPNGFNIEWANGQDICPDDLYYKSEQIEESTERLSALAEKVEQKIIFETVQERKNTPASEYISYEDTMKTAGL